MATKRTAQLQTELLTDEDFDLFLGIKGLLVIEVYSEWCGPCLGIVGSLRRLKYELGDNLTLAIAKADTISYVNRFYKRSEPVWLFITEGRAVNIMFGTDTPRLTQMIREEVGLLPKFQHRETFSLDELLPEEEKRNKIKNEAKEKIQREEKAARDREKADFFAYITDAIIDNLPDIGITIFGPHVNRDLYRKLTEFGFEKLGIQCKDRRNQAITKEQFEFINTACTNPLSPDVIDAIDGKELFICFWKIPDDKSKHRIHEILDLYAEELSKPQTHPSDEYQDAKVTQPPLISSLKLTVEYELPEDQECPYVREPEPEIPKKQKIQQTQEMPQEVIEVGVEEYFSEMGSEEDEEIPVELKQQSIIDIEFTDFDNPLDDVEEEEYIEEGPSKNICKKIVTIPGIWVPKDRATHAALIYLLFRSQTVGFLPPDPVPEPPHVIMAFNTYKQRDLLEFAERYKDDIPSYGYFTSDDVEEAKFIANSKQNYAHVSHSASDKLVFKVNKRTSNTMLSLVSYGPTYVSFNTNVGKEEALRFFPEDYVTAEKELIQLAEAAKETTSKKGGKNKDQKDSEMYNKLQEEAAMKEAEEAAIREAEEAAMLEMEKEGEQEVEAGNNENADQNVGGEGEPEGEGGEALEGGDLGEGTEIPPGDSPQVVAEPVSKVEELPPPESPEVAKEPIAPAEEPVAVETAAVETPAVETPAVETPAVETPAVETPAVEAPAVETPAVETAA